jgi:hypothetical protein
VGSTPAGDIFRNYVIYFVKRRPATGGLAHFQQHCSVARQDTEPVKPGGNAVVEFTALQKKKNRIAMMRKRLAL